jgi:valyl-tRNA synthetase
VYYQTDAPYYRRLTQITFIRLFKKGLVYKGEFPVNWCPRCGTALAESEVEYETRKTYLNYIVFREKDTGRDVVIATTRPELLPTCQLVAVHPEDERYRDLVGKTLITPIFGREVPVVADEKVEPDFGTGVVMICTIGDKDDLNWVYKYNLKLEKGIDEEGRMTSLAKLYEDDGSPWNPDYSALTEAAGKVETISSNLRWKDWTRYSSRQDRRMKLGGVVGNIVFGRGAHRFINLIRAGEALHLGKSTTFGLGKIKIIHG